MTAPRRYHAELTAYLDRWPGVPQEVADICLDLLFDTADHFTGSLNMTPGQWSCVPGVTARLRTAADLLDALHNEVDLPLY